MRQTFCKTLSANDVGSTGAHQAGMLVPKSESELLKFLPPLDPKVKNADAWIKCADEDGNQHKFRFVYYNNRLHDVGGTRNEYRITYMTAYFRQHRAREGDVFTISRADGAAHYEVRIERPGTPEAAGVGGQSPQRIKLRPGWQRVC